MAIKHVIMSSCSCHIFLILIISSYFVISSSSSDAEFLLRFKSSLKNVGALSNWDIKRSPCHDDQEIWNGVLCNNGTIWGLKLENMGLGGVIDMDSLTEMRSIRTLSFINNNFDGNLPDLFKLGNLKSIYLSNNKFYGAISPGTFIGMQSLKKLHMDYNFFSGSIPISLTSLTKLKELSLKYNSFDGGIPDFPQGNIFSIFNVSHNQLMGEIPVGLSHMNESAFLGNKGLCGAPLKPCTISTTLSIGTIVIVAMPIVATLAALVAVVIILRQRKKTPLPHITLPEQESNVVDLDKIEQGHLISASSTPEHLNHGKKGVKLTFLNESMHKFEMTDLLKASAEILGSGVFGSSYKASLDDGKMMVVKRFKHMNNVSKDEFHEHMTRLGKLKHPNVLSIVAFCYRKDEKLLVTEFVKNVSLVVHLHTNRSRGLVTPDWPRRLNIVKGVANGLKYIYDELPSLTTPHGHLKSSNVLLDESFNPILTDYGLIPVVNQENAQEHMISYKSPEYKKNRRITKKTDVWGLGILILEILTGTSPSNFLQKSNDNDMDLTTWVESVVHENNVRVFDAEMEGTKNLEGEMMKLLKIGLSCCVPDVDKRPDITEAVKKIEEINENDNDDDFYSAYTSDGRSSRGFSYNSNVSFN